MILDETPPPNLDDPDWPVTCAEKPADYCPLGYLAWHAMAEARTKRGERQRYCRTCERYAWPTTPCTKLRQQECPMAHTTDLPPPDPAEPLRRLRDALSPWTTPPGAIITISADELRAALRYLYEHPDETVMLRSVVVPRTVR